MKSKVKSKKAKVKNRVANGRSLRCGAFLPFAFLLFTSVLLGQFQITQSVIAGGGLTSNGGVFSLSGTTGQSSTSTSNTTTNFELRAGFWAESFAPTAAGVSIGGQVRTVTGTGIRNARITLTHLATGETTSALSSSFGYYRFDDVQVGHLYLISIESKRFVFEPNSRVISLLDEITNEDFVGDLR